MMTHLIWIGLMVGSYWAAIGLRTLIREARENDEREMRERERRAKRMMEHDRKG